MTGADSVVGALRANITDSTCCAARCGAGGGTDESWSVRSEADYAAAGESHSFRAAAVLSGGDEDGITGVSAVTERHGSGASEHVYVSYSSSGDEAYTVSDVTHEYEWRAAAEFS